MSSHISTSSHQNGEIRINSVHIFAASHQPATRFVVDLGSFDVIEDLAVRVYIPRPKVIRLKPRVLVFAQCCGRRRWAQHCTTQVYYDAQPFWCKPGLGCKRT